MNLTKQEAIQWHRKMWIWIAKEIARNKQVLDIVTLKKVFILNNGLCKIKSDCFCCDYVYHNNKEQWYEDEFYCDEYCPIVWNEGYCCASRSEYHLIICVCNNWKKQAKLAYKIAMLPERESA